MRFNESTQAIRFQTWARFTKSSRNLKEALLRSVEFECANEKYLLLPFRNDDLQNVERIKLLGAWRDAHQYAYPTRFPVSDSGTRNWLEKSVLQLENRVMFWVADESLNLFGHLGLLLNSDGEIEVDNVLKGVEGRPGLFSKAMLQLEQIVLAEFGTKKLVLKVLDQNSHAIEFYEKLGFSLANKVGMKWEESTNTKILVQSNVPYEFLNTMSKNLENLEEVPALILTAGPSISTMEISNVNDAVTYGWNNHHSDYIKSFEKRFADLLGVEYAMSTSSCTGALHLALLSLGIGPGDEVIVPDITWVATASAVAYTGATPVFADVDRHSWNISVETIESLVTKRTRAIIPVHLYGYAAPMQELKLFADNRGILIVEDAAPAIGTQIGGKLAGTFGNFGCFSFQGAKLLVTGEGGMLVTNDKRLYEKAWKIQDHGRKPGTFWIEELGHKYKMNNITAALGLAQIERADVQIERKREINALYQDLILNDGSVTFQNEISNSQSICWMTSIKLSAQVSGQISDLAFFLKENGIDSRPVFPTIHAYPMWESNVHNPVASEISSRALNLPSGVTMSNKSIAKVSEKINQWLTSNV